jgi:putative membrane protein
MSVTKLITGAAALALVLASAPALHAQTPAQQDTSHSRWGVLGGPTMVKGQARVDLQADTAFIREAMAGSLMEVRLGTLAEGRASASAVKQFGQRMVTDHGAMQKQWSALASSNGMRITASLDAEQQQTAARLGALSGAAFDQAYMSTMVQDHQNDAAAFRQQASSARSAEVRQLASSGLATIEQHLSLAQQVASQVGTAPVATTTTPTPSGGGVIPGTTPSPRTPVPTTQPPVPTTQPANPNNRAAVNPGNDRGNVTSDREFVHEVLADHITELRMAQLAQRRAKGADAKRLANHMADDMKRWRDRWSGVASNSGMDATPALGNLHRQKLDRLEKASKQEFDRTYAAVVVEHLQSIVPYFQDEGRSARSSKVRGLVNDELPVIRDRLAEARRLRGDSNDRAEASGHGRKVAEAAKDKDKE